MSLKFRLHKYSGEDRIIINKSDEKAKSDFALIGFSVILVFCLTIVSIVPFFLRLFHSYLVAFIMGALWAGMFITIYLLMLYSISPSLVKHSSEEQAKKELNKDYKSQTATSSLAIRIGFLIFMAFLISQPIKVEMTALMDTGHINELVDAHKKELCAKLDSRDNEVRKAQETLIQTSDFYIYRIKTINEKFLLEYITIGFIFIFLLPVNWKFQLRKRSNFYKVKQAIEQRIVADEYYSFKAQYQKTFKENFDLQVEFYEPYHDPPFNEVKKKHQQTGEKQEELLKQIYG